MDASSKKKKSGPQLYLRCFNPTCGIYFPYKGSKRAFWHKDSCRKAAERAQKKQTQPLAV